MTSLEVSVGPEGVQARPSPGAGWALEDKDGEHRVLLDTNSISLETRKYGAYENMREAFISVLKDFVRTVNPGERTRLGLRYVNHLVFDDATSPTEWRKFIRPELLGLVAVPDVADDSDVIHSIAETRLAYDNSQLVARYGYLWAGVGLDGFKVDRPFFMIDVDYFDVRPTPSVDPEGIAIELDEFHADIYGIFRWALTPETETRLGIVGGPA